MTYDLRYRTRAQVEDLAIGECTIHRATGSAAPRWWLLWALVARDDNGASEVIGVPVNPNGTWLEAGPGGKTWGLTRAEAGIWQIAPSINVIAGGDAHAGDHAEQSQWHQTPRIVGVPDDEPWITGAP